MGAIAVLDPRDDDNLDRIAELTNGVGMDAALDCSGNVHAQRFCIDAVRRRSQICFIGESSSDLAIQASRDFIRKGISLHGSWHYNPRLIQDCKYTTVDCDGGASHLGKCNAP